MYRRNSDISIAEPVEVGRQGRSRKRRNVGHTETQGSE